MNENGRFEDHERIAYLKEHTAVIEKLCEDGIDITGYYVWSAMDLLSWTNGYQKRYGLVGVNFDTMERTVKKSGEWYREFIRQENKK